MKRIIISLVLSATLLTSFSQAYAANIFQNCGTGSAAGTPDVCTSVHEEQSTNDNPIIKILKAAIEVISFVTGVLAVIFIIISGLKFVTAGGDSNAVASARSTLVYALVGIAVTVLAQSIVVFVLDKV